MLKFFSCRFWLLFGVILLFIIPIVHGESTKLIELDFKNADVKDVLRALAEQSNNTFLIDDDVTGIVTIHLAKLTFTDALNIISKNKGLVYTKENKIYHISQLDNSSLKVDFQDGLLSVDSKNAKVRQLLTAISDKTGIKMVPAPELQDRITIVFDKIILVDGIKTILTQANCIEEKIGQVSYIRKKSTTVQLGININYVNNLLTIDTQNAPLANVTRAISEKTGITIVPEQSLTTSISIFLQNLPLADALGMICDTYNLQLIKEDQAWRITRKSGSYRVRYKNNALSVDADGVEVTELLNEISRQSGENIMVSREVRGPITSHFQDVPFQQALTSMLDTQGWIIEKQQNSYNVRPNTTPGQNIRVNYDATTKLFDIDVQSAQITSVINEMARRADLNVVIMAQVNWSINNIRLKQQSFAQSLGYLLEGTIFTYRLDGNTYIIGDGMMVRAENGDFSIIKVYPLKFLKADAVLNTLPPVFPMNSFRQIPEKNALIVTAPPNIQDQFTAYLDQMDAASINDRTEVIRVKNLKAEDVLKLFPSSIPKNDIIVVKEMNALTVTGPQNLINQVKQYIDKIDQVNPMIIFDVKVVLVNDSDKVNWTPPSAFDLRNGTQLGIDYATGAIGLTALEDTILPKLNLLLSNGLAKIIQNPTMTTLNGYQTSFSVSTKRTYAVSETQTPQGGTPTTTTTFKPVDSGLYITITPWVSDNKQITMEIKPKISQYGAAPQGQTIPETTEHSTETTIRVNDGETVVISGLKTARKSKSVTKFPILGDIPLLGLIFRSTNYENIQDEFVLVITPHLVYDEESKIETIKKVQEHFSPNMQIEMNNADTNADISLENKIQTRKTNDKAEMTNTSKEMPGDTQTTPADTNVASPTPTPVPKPTPTPRPTPVSS